MLPVVRFVQAGVMLLGGIGYAVLLAWFYSISAWNTQGSHSLIGLVLPTTSGGASLYDEALRVSIPPFVAWNAALLIVTVLVIIDANRKARAGRSVVLASGVFIVKLAAIPFFIANFVLLGLNAAAGVITLPFGGPIFLAAVAIASVLTYLAMLSTSIYGWATVSRFRREQRISKSQGVMYSLLLCIFVLDIAVGILLFTESRRTARSTTTPLMPSS
jgi:hypothetical protein